MTSTPPLSTGEKALDLEQEPLDFFTMPMPDALTITRQQTDQTMANDVTPIEPDNGNNAFAMPALITRQKTDNTPHSTEANATIPSMNNNNSNNDEAEIILPPTLLRQKTDNTLHSKQTRQQTDDTKNNNKNELYEMATLDTLDMPLQISRQQTDQTDKDIHNKSPSPSPDMPSVNDLLLAPITRQQTDQNINETDMEVMEVDHDSQENEAVLFDFDSMNLERQQTDILVEKKELVGDDIGGDAFAMSMKLATMEDISRRTTDMATNMDEEESANLMIDQMDVSNDAVIKFLPSRVTATDSVKEEVASNEYLDESLLMFDADGKLLDNENLSGVRKIENENEIDSENSAQIQTIEDDDCFNQFIEHKQPIICMAFAPNKSYEIITGGQDETCYRWNIIDYDCSMTTDVKTEEKSNSNKQYFKLNDHSDTIIDCAFNKTGKFMATAAMDNSIKIYNCKKENKLISSLDVGAEISFIKWHCNDKNLLMAGSLDKNVWLYKYDKANKKFENTQILCGHSGKIECGGFTKYNGGVYGYSGDEDGMVAVWENIMNNAFVGKKKYSFKPDKKLATLYHEAGVNTMDDCSTAPLLISGSSDHSVCLINYENGKILHKLGKHEDSVECVRFNQLNVLNVASSSALDGCVKVWDLNKGKIRNVLQHNDAVIVHRWFNTENNSSFMVSGCMNGGVYVWDIRTEKVVKEFKGHQKCCIQTVQVSNDDKYIVSGADDSTAMVWKF